jgi:ABC-type Fe3+/spermidine/putrescine transport system ATPase subunit
MINLESCHYSPENSAGFTFSVDSLSIASGERVFVVGPSGSGKTTLLKALAGLLQNSTGKLYIDGDLIDTSRSSANQKNMMYLSQDLGLWPHLTSRQHLAFVASRGKSLQDDGAHLWLDLVGLQHRYDSRPHQLSGGEQKRLALARALAAEPQYLFLDEPFANIDLVLAQELMALLDEEQEKKKFSLIKVTHHYLGIACNNVTLLVVIQGRIVQQGTLTEITNNPLDEWTAKWVRLVT